jgi:amino acid transporter
MTWVVLALMTTGSVASLRPAPTMAVYGLATVFLYVLPAVLFLLPTAMVSAELASGWKGGVYNWVTQGISPKAGMFAAWNQFAMTIFYYPTLLSYLAATLAYVVAPSLASNGIYTAAVIIGVFWAGVLVSLRGGIGVIAKLASSGLVLGTLLPGTLLVILGLMFLGEGNDSAAPMDVGHMLPAWAGISSIVLIVSNFGAYEGMEMNAVHVNDLRKPSTEFPRAMFVSMGLVLVILILPPLAISWAVPAQNISLTAGVMQAFDAVFGHFGIGWLTPVVGIGIALATVTGFLTWLAGPSKSLLLIGRQEGFLPPFFQRTNKVGVQENILLVQGVVTTILALLFALVPNVSSGYWIFMVITTEVYLTVYFLMFVAAVRLRRNQPDHPRGFRAPALFLQCVVGFLAALAAFIIGFFPPSQFAGGGALSFIAMIGGGVLLLGVLVPAALLKFSKPSWKQSDIAADPSAAPPDEQTPSTDGPGT